MRTRAMSVIVRTAVVLLALCGLTHISAGQQPAGQRPIGAIMLPVGFESAFEPYYVRRDVETVMDALAATAEQSPVLTTLFADYATEFHAAANDYQTRVRDAAPILDDAAETKRALQVAYQRDIEELIRRHQEAGDESPEAGQALEAAIETRAEQLQQAMQDASAAALASAEVQAKLEQSVRQFEEWIALRSRLRSGLESSVSALLEEPQQAAWERMQRAMRREKSLRRHGRLSGESADLILLAEQVQLPASEQEAAAPILADYETAIDQAVAERDEALETLDRQLDRAIHKADADQVSRSLRSRMSQRVIVRDINIQTAERLAAAIAEPGRSAFVSALKRQSFPRVYRRSATERLLAAAENLEGLSEDTAEQLSEVSKAYQSELAAANDRIESLILQHEGDALIAREMAEFGLASPEQPERNDQPAMDPIRQAYLDRAQLESRYQQQMNQILSPEQRQQLPQTGHEGPEESGSGELPQHPPEPTQARNDRLHDSMESFRRWALENFDENGDGQYSQLERQRLSEYLHQHPEARPPG